jgi:hypothetical protein
MVTPVSVTVFISTELESMDTDEAQLVMSSFECSSSHLKQ